MKKMLSKIFENFKRKELHWSLFCQFCQQVFIYNKEAKLQAPPVNFAELFKVTYFDDQQRTAASVRCKDIL